MKTACDIAHRKITQENPTSCLPAGTRSERALAEAPPRRRPGRPGTGSVAREIVRLSQEPAYKDRKWSLPADTRAARGPGGGVFQRGAPDRSDSLPETSERGGVVIREALKCT